MWFMNYGLGGSFPVVTHLFPLGLAAVTTLIGLVEVVVAEVDQFGRRKKKQFRRGGDFGPYVKWTAEERHSVSYGR
jgi:hypothetical protein